jgi:hypothetical protein
MKLDSRIQAQTTTASFPVSEPRAQGEIWKADFESATAAALARGTLECGDLSPLSLLNDRPAREGMSSARSSERHTRILRCDGDVWPAQSGDRSPHSRRLGRWLAILSVLALSFSAARAQNFAIDWHTIDGGGGTSSGGNFSLSGTIGQPDASAQPMTGGAFSLTGGFWSLFAVQTPEAPLLTILRISANSARVSWPSPSTGFGLQENTDLTSSNWVNAPQAVSDNGTDKFITVNPSAGRRFYRLVKP